jgi:hydroxymethylpyrimidine pyrophosphatase-like HAD family hydrolase
VVVFFANDDEMDKTREALAADGRFAISSSVPRSIEINSARAGKGTALLKPAELLQVDLESTIGVGDNFNDVPMFDCAALSLCVANGDSVAKEHADRMICESEYGIAKYIYENLI